VEEDDGAAGVPMMIDLAACAIHQIQPSSNMLKLILGVHLYMKPYIGKTMNFSNYLRTCRSEIRGWYGWELTCRSPMEGRPGRGL